MADLYRLPFVAPEAELPAPLPALEDIEASGDILVEQTGRRVVRTGDFVIKFGIAVSLTEGQNMLFVAQTQTVPVPKVYALLEKTNAQGDSVKYIIMQNIHGYRLDVEWDQMDSSTRAGIASNLRTSLAALRTVPSPGYFGCLGKRPFEDSFLWTAPEDDIECSLIRGPHDDEIKFNEALIQKYIYNSGLEVKAKYYRRVLPRVFHGHGAVFTHGDIQRKNIIVKDDGTAVLIDWEASGWYPEYWDYALAIFSCGAWKDDWHEYIGMILDEYPVEYAWFDMLAKEMWS